MDDLIFRTALPSDKPQILEIAAQTWDGDDYIPYVIDDWLDSGTTSLIAAESHGRVVGVARYVRLFPRYAWFEGLRVDPAYTGRGIAKHLTQRLVELAQADGVERIGLSTYLNNHASQRVSAAFGFGRVIGFAACSADAKGVKHVALSSDRVEEVPVEEALAIVRASEALSAGRGFLPHSWRFYPFFHGPELAMSHIAHRLGIRHDGKLRAMLCIGDHTPHGPTSFSLDFLEGEPEALVELVRHGLCLITQESYIEAMVPCRDGVALPTLQVLREIGFEPWNGGREDVLVFERAGSLP
jgi:GNAT superfamily N-acetyltransferase